MGLLSYFILFSFLILTVSSHETFNNNINDVPNDQTQTYIVRVENSLKPSLYSNVVDWYSSTLKSLNSTKNILHIYSTVFEGFSAKLSKEQALDLKQRPEILGVFPDRLRKIHTTRSPEFLGLETTAADNNNNNNNNKNSLLVNVTDFGSDVIIGLMDTGIWPERRSFEDAGLGPVPTRWRGGCHGGEGFPESACNKKLIGVRYFNEGHVARFGVGDQNGQFSARDDIGHGTHTASTAAGRRVGSASFFGYAPGASSGIAHMSRIAMYKVCWDDGCDGSDILAGIDAAVRDGVNVISISLGGPPMEYDEDTLAIASFAAVKKGIFVSASAGNSGPSLASASNLAPWMTTVAAGSIDRTFPADIILGDGRVITGSSLYAGDEFNDNDNGTFFPLYYAGLNGSVTESGYCLPGSLDPNLVKGKIVVCDQSYSYEVGKAEVVREAGGTGTVVANVENAGEGLTALPFLSPGISVTFSARAKLVNYLQSSVDPARAKMRFRGTHLGAKPAPVASYFSSRGPSVASPSVLKPDLIAPGVNILAAWPEGVSPSFLSGDTRSTEFNIISGTSMSCPHVSGIAALLRGAHPGWSSAMIKSAMMTTAYNVDRDGGPIMDETNYTKATPWDVGAGHVDPIKAVDPGLVYDLTVKDYIGFLCASNYSSRRIKVITGSKRVDCKKYAGTNTWDLNYPAIVAILNVSSSGPSRVEILVPRKVVHVSDGESTYTVKISIPKGTTVSVDPVKMVFRKKGETRRYKVKISADDKRSGNDFDFGLMTWTDGKHNVTSPLVVIWN